MWSIIRPHGIGTLHQAPMQPPKMLPQVFFELEYLNSWIGVADVGQFLFPPPKVQPQFFFEREHMNLWTVVGLLPFPHQ